MNNNGLQQVKKELSISTADLPESVNGLTVNTNDIYNIYVNNKLDPDSQAAAFLHEMLHIWNNDFDSQEEADQIELRTHEQLKRISDIFTTM